MARPFIVGITGGSGSGKTMFMNKLMEVLPEASLHSMDNYYKAIDKQPIDENGIQNFDMLESIDFKKYEKDLQTLISGEILRIKEYTFNNDKSKAKEIVIESNPVILVEGIFVLHHENLRNLMDLKLYVDAPDYLMMSRRIIRDAEERGYDLNDVLYRYKNHVTPAFKSYTEPSKNWADLIIPNHEDFGKALSVIGTYLNQFYKENESSL